MGFYNDLLTGLKLSACNFLDVKTIEVKAKK
jgi:hypothetical protein